MRLTLHTYLPQAQRLQSTPLHLSISRGLRAHRSPPLLHRHGCGEAQLGEGGPCARARPGRIEFQPCARARTDRVSGGMTEVSFDGPRLFLPFQPLVALLLYIWPFSVRVGETWHICPLAAEAQAETTVPLLHPPSHSWTPLHPPVTSDVSPRHRKHRFSAPAPWHSCPRGLGTGTQGS